MRRRLLFAAGRLGRASRAALARGAFCAVQQLATPPIVVPALSVAAGRLAAIAFLKYEVGLATAG